jgi:restriction endonuclease Mrr
MTEQPAAVQVTELRRAGLLDKVENGFAPHNWAGRQYQSDSSTKREEHRDRKKREIAVTGNISSDVSVTSPEQSRTETEQSRRAARCSSRFGGRGAAR